MDSKLAWKSVLIVFVVLMCAWTVWPPSETLVLGPDLKGGTTLLYEVAVPDDADAEETLGRVIEVIRRRVDPAGVRNLVFQIQAGNRIQILMPHASEEVRQRQKRYETVRKEIEGARLTRSKVLAVLRADPSVRPAGITAMAG
ncbi:MAG: hypothetical protein OER86_05055, partial [Phycisphaerae bacterium]|nr:hypothetical protein [Phycisphaerae bacterium]